MTSDLTPAKRGQYARSEDTRQRILGAAMALASDSGFQNVSISAIAKEAGVALGIVNYHFGSKKRLLMELMASRVADFVSRLAPRAEGEDFFTYEQSLLRGYLEFLHDNPSYVRLADEVRHLAPDIYRKGVSSNVAEISKRIHTGIQQGDLRAMTEPEVLAQAYLVQGAYSFLDRFLEDPQYPGDSVLLAAVNNLLHAGLGAKR